MEKLTCTYVHLHGMTFEGREDALAGLLQSLDRAGGWVLERHADSAHRLTLWLEMQTRVLVDIYAAIAGSPVALTRESHMTMAEQCTCLRHLRGKGGLSAILTVRFDIAFLSPSAWHSSWLDGAARRDTAV